MSLIVRADERRMEGEGYRDLGQFVAARLHRVITLLATSAIVTVVSGICTFKLDGITPLSIKRQYCAVAFTVAGVIGTLFLFALLLGFCEYMDRQRITAQPEGFRVR